VNEETELDYFKNGLVLGLSLGLISGLTSAFWYQKKRTLHADIVLERVKKAFLQEGPIEGSWIEFEKKPLRKFAIHSKIYTGGISRLEDGLLTQYSFIADASTGTVLDVTRLKA